MQKKPVIITTPIPTREQFRKAIGMSKKRAAEIEREHREAASSKRK